MEKVKVFIAHSTHGGDDNSVYDKLAEHYQNSDLLEVINVDDSNHSLVLKKITDNIDECDLFVCDLTSEVPIDDNNKYSLVNSNVMFEIGYAYAKNKECIYIINEDKNNLIIPSMLNGVSLVTYGNDYDMLEVIDALDNKYYNYKKKSIKSHIQKYGQKCPFCMKCVINEKEFIKITNDFCICMECNDMYIDAELFDYLKYLNDLSGFFNKKSKSLVNVIDKYINCNDVDFSKIINTDINLISLCNLFFIFENERQDFTKEYLTFCNYFLYESYKHRHNKFIQKLVIEFENRFEGWTTCVLSQNFELILPIYVCLFLFKDSDELKLKSFEIWEHQFRKHNIYEYTNHIEFVKDIIKYYYSFSFDISLIDKYTRTYLSDYNLLLLIKRHAKCSCDENGIIYLIDKYLKLPIDCPILCKKCDDHNWNFGKNCEHNGFFGRIKFCILFYKQPITLQILR